MKFRLLFLLSILWLASSCGKQKENRVFYVNSYHAGYPSSDEIYDGIKSTLNDKGIELKSAWLDSKRHNDSASISNAANRVLGQFMAFRPDLLIVSDDNAVRYFLKTNLDKIKVPVVFCGVNWDAGGYHLPRGQVTGMLEVLPLKETIDYLKRYYPDAGTLAVLSENTPSEKKNSAIIDTLTGMKVIYRMVNDFDEWKKAFIQLNATAGMLFLPTNGAVKNWGDKAAETFVKDHIKIPVFTCDDFMMKYCVYGRTKVAREQGEWAAATALRILHGTKPGDIKVSRNHESTEWYNPVLGKIIGFDPPGSAKMLRP